ncbi:MAG: CcmD family protein [Candidatus Krumholzibacteria bacterium]|nr:CcmD family protein [Candidatus Krumholzibacteria bacterium]
MGWLFAAYAIIWTVFFLYANNLHKRQKAIMAEMASLTKKLAEKTGG